MSIRDRIDPELLAWYEASPGFDFDDLDTFVAKCNAAELANLRPDPAVAARDEEIPGPAGAPAVKVRLYEPAVRDGQALPCVFFYHGGGFLFGSVYRQEALCQRYVKNVGCVVVSVEYRLAPRWKTPAPIEDCYAALTHFHENAPSYGIDPDRLAVCGLSARASASRSRCTRSWTPVWTRPRRTRSWTPRSGAATTARSPGRSSSTPAGCPTSTTPPPWRGT